MDLFAIVGRFLDRPRVARLRAVLDAYGRAPGGLLASGLAFSAIFAIVPITLLTVGLAGRLADDDAVQQAIAAALVRVFPPLEEPIVGTLDALVDGAVVMSLLGLLGTVWTVSRLYVALDVAVARVFGSPTGRTALRQNLRAFIWVALLIGGVVLYIVATSVTSALGSVIPHTLPSIRLLALVLGSPVTTFAVAIVTVALTYRTVPPVTPGWHAVLLPAVSVGVAIVGLGQAFAVLAPWLVGVATLVGPLAVAFVALAWLSLVFQALLFGVAWVRVRHEDAMMGSGALGAD